MSDMSPVAPSATSAVVRPQPQLQVSSISVVYSRTVRAVHDLSFTVGKGEIVALLGPNGAGKSTTMRALSGFLPGDNAQLAAGSIKFNGQELGHLQPHVSAHKGVALVGERDKIFSTLSVEENLNIGAMVNPSRKDALELRSFVYALFPRLQDRKRQLAGYLSGGERQMLAVSAALLGRPSLLMVDELSLGLAPKVVSELSQVLRRINREQGLSILLVEQSAAVAFAISDHIYMLNLGRSVADGTASELKKRKDFSLSYLGVPTSKSEPTESAA
jgi:branched-chain amino acid transport system ATP-binding protein